MNAFQFFQTALKDYRRVGAVTRTSNFVSRRLLQEVLPQYRYVVEYGAGDGTVTRELLKHLPADGRVAALELNPRLAQGLRAISDPRLSVVFDDVRAIARDFSRLNFPRVDAVISGVPLSFLPAGDRKALVDNTYLGLAAGGRFILYQYTPAVASLLRKHFRSVRVHCELRNLPPYFIIVAEK